MHKFFTIQARTTVLKPPGSKGAEYFSSGITVAKAELEHLDIADLLKSGAIKVYDPSKNALPDPPYMTTRAEVQTKIDDAVGAARIEWEADHKASGGQTTIGNDILAEIEAIVAPVQGDRGLVDVIRESVERANTVTVIPDKPSEPLDIPVDVPGPVTGSKPLFPANPGKPGK